MNIAKELRRRRTIAQRSLEDALQASVDEIQFLKSKVNDNKTANDGMVNCMPSSNLRGCAEMVTYWSDQINLLSSLIKKTEQ